MSTWYFLQNVCMCVLKDIVDVKQFLDKSLSEAYKHYIIPVYCSEKIMLLIPYMDSFHDTQFCQIRLKTLYGRITEN